MCVYKVHKVESRDGALYGLSFDVIRLYEHKVLNPRSLVLKVNQSQDACVFDCFLHESFQTCHYLLKTVCYVLDLYFGSNQPHQIPTTWK